MRHPETVTKPILNIHGRGDSGTQGPQGVISYTASQTSDLTPFYNSLSNDNTKGASIPNNLRTGEARFWPEES